MDSGLDFTSMTTKFGVKQADLMPSFTLLRFIKEAYAKQEQLKFVQ
jgi:hypothetical protein